MNIIISKKNLQLLNALYIKYKAFEIGGVLLGKKENGDYIITDIVYNLSGANLKKLKFTRSICDLKDAMVKLIVDNHYNIDYIGEWHTHPNGSSSYSGMDKKAMNELNEDFPELILLIKAESQISTYLCTLENIQRMEFDVKEVI